jgi:hypothetical protein
MGHTPSSNPANAEVKNQGCRSLILAYGQGSCTEIEYFAINGLKSKIVLKSVISGDY